MDKTQQAPAAAKPTRAKELTAEGKTAVRRFAMAFGAALPPGAPQAGHYQAKEDDRFAGDTLDVPDGVYRVTGHDWLFTFRKGKFIAAGRAAPHADNKGVIAVTPNTHGE